MITYFVLCASLLLGVYCSQNLENAINPNTQNSLSAQYSDSNSEEDIILKDSYNNQNQEDVPLHNNPHENTDYETYEPRTNFKPMTVPYNYPNRVKYGHHKPQTALRNPYRRTRYPSMINMPSHSVYTYSPGHPPSPVLENPYQQQPVYANLYWRKIVYPYPQYSGQSSNNENIILGNSLANPLTEESRVIDRRYMNPYKKHYRHRNRYPSPKTGYRTSHFAAFYPISGYSVWKRNQLSRFKPNSTLFTSPALYKRKRKVRPVHPIHNHYNLVQSKSFT